MPGYAGRRAGGGGGDSFASGLIYGLLTEADLVRSLNLGAAHGALAMPTVGDISMATSTRSSIWVAGQGTFGLLGRVHTRASTDRCWSHHRSDAASAIWESLRATRSSAPSRLCW